MESVFAFLLGVVFYGLKLISFIMNKYLNKKPNI